MEPIVCVYHDEQRAPDPVELVGEDHLESTGFGIREQASSPGALTHRHGAGDRLVLVDPNYLVAVELAVFLQEAVLSS